MQPGDLACIQAFQTFLQAATQGQATTLQEMGGRTKKMLPAFTGACTRYGRIVDMVLECLLKVPHGNRKTNGSSGSYGMAYGFLQKSGVTTSVFGGFHEFFGVA